VTSALGVAAISANAVIVTSLERAGSPLGSGLFQLTPNVSRSTTVWSANPKRSPP
jgi:hypothetical protein